MVKFLRLSSGGAFRSKGLRSGWLLSDRRLRSIPPVTQQIGGVDLIGSGLGGTGQLYYRGCRGVRDGVDTPSSYPTATCPPVGWSNG